MSFEARDKANKLPVTSQNEKTTLLGKTQQDYASIVRRRSFANTEILPTFGAYFLPILGRAPFNKKAGDDALANAYKSSYIIEKHLLINTYLVGERLTLADLFVAGIYQRVFQFVLDKKWRSNNPNTTRWFETVVNQPIYSAAAPPIEMVGEILKNVPPKSDAPKKEKAPPAPKAAPKPKEPEEEAEEEAPPAPKPKHPLEALDRPTLVLDDWKRKYSNEETREVALPWFWENLKTEEYSLWKVDYKYNDELKMIFMSSNLVGIAAPTLPTVLNIALISKSRWFLRSSRSLAQIPLWMRFSLRRVGSQCDPRCLPGSRAGGSPRL